MPSTATITAFYTFAANTKARANYVNTNFSNYRGHIVAIDPNTATAAATETYDLGSTEYRWRTGYFREVDFKSNTTTGQALQIVGDTAAGSGAFNFHVGSTLPAQIGYNGFQGNLYGHLNKPIELTTTGSTGQITRVILSAATITTNNTYINGASITITTIGRPVEIVLQGDTSSPLSVFYNTISGSGHNPYGRFILYRASTVVDQLYIGHAYAGGSNTTDTFYLGNLTLRDLSAPAGVNTYRLKFTGSNAASALNIDPTGYFIAREI